MEGKMSRPNNSFTTLAGVPVHYDRLRNQDYGTRGIPHRFYVTPEFESKLDECFGHLWEVCPYGRAAVITSAGTYVAKPGFHGLGRALDLDGLFWPNKTFVTLYDGFQGRNLNLYIGIESVIRMHFGQVLNFSYNAAHRDHFHIDDVEPGFRQGARSSVLFLQNALNYTLGHAVRRTGSYDNETQSALALALRSLDIDGDIRNPEVWLEFLTRLSVKAFSVAQETPDFAEHDLLRSAGRSGREAEGAGNVLDSWSLEAISPVVLLDNLYQVIQDELGDTALRMPVEGAVTAFVGHPDVQALLERHNGSDTNSKS
jgi:hypothetical protein